MIFSSYYDYKNFYSLIQFKTGLTTIIILMHELFNLILHLIHKILTRFVITKLTYYILQGHYKYIII